MCLISQRHAFVNTLPSRPYCADVICEGLKIRPREKAIEFMHIQLNSPIAVNWLTFDIDAAGAYFAANDANLAQPNIICENPNNGHAHISYWLSVPVWCSAASKLRPLLFLRAIQRGYTRRLKSDHSYSGLIAKNPLHKAWRTEWPRKQPYTLAELDDFLFHDDKKFIEKKSEDYGLGRNCTLFNEMRKLAYKESRKAKSHEELFLTILDAGLSMNIGFCPPLYAREVRAIAKSVAKWVWARFSPERFSEVQSQRGSCPWRHREVLSRLKPWEEMEISRSTYYRERQQKTLQER